MGDNLETLGRYIEAVNARRPAEAHRCLAPGFSLVRNDSVAISGERAGAAAGLDWDAALERHVTWSVRFVGARSIGILGTEMNCVRYLLDLPAIAFETTFEFDDKCMIGREKARYKDPNSDQLKSQLERALAWARFRRPDLFVQACDEDDGKVRGNAEAARALCTIVRDWSREVSASNHSGSDSSRFRVRGKGRAKSS